MTGDALRLVYALPSRNKRIRVKGLTGHPKEIVRMKEAVRAKESRTRERPVYQLFYSRINGKTSASPPTRRIEPSPSLLDETPDG